MKFEGENKKALVKDILENRSQYAGFITILLTIIVLTVASVLVLQFESQSPDAKITTGGDAFWYSIVTITTVGYGDYYPVTRAGRITAMFIMFMGVGIIGALASILASLLVGGSSCEEETPAADQPPRSKKSSRPSRMSWQSCTHCWRKWEQEIIQNKRNSFGSGLLFAIEPVQVGRER